MTYCIIKLYIETQNEVVIIKNLTYQQAEEKSEELRYNETDHNITYYLASE